MRMTLNINLRETPLAHPPPATQGPTVTIVTGEICDHQPPPPPSKVGQNHAIIRAEKCSTKVVAYFAVFEPMCLQSTLEGASLNDWSHISPVTITPLAAAMVPQGHLANAKVRGRGAKSRREALPSDSSVPSFSMALQSAKCIRFIGQSAKRL